MPTDFLQIVSSKIGLTLVSVSDSIFINRNENWLGSTKETKATSSQRTFLKNESEDQTDYFIEAFCQWFITLKRKKKETLYVTRDTLIRLKLFKF